MPKVKSAFVCQNCGTQSPKWVGRCSACGEWNTYVEEIMEKDSLDKINWRQGNGNYAQAAKPALIDEVEDSIFQRIVTPDNELNRVLGGGIVPGSVVLVGGEPGIGKSTLLLQVALQLPNAKILYVSGEESEQQIKMRATRVGIKNKKCYLYSETSMQHINSQLKELQPAMVIIDSIQTLHSSHIDSAPGSVSQIRECAAELQRYAKESGTPVFIIGHITKEGVIAGPKVLEHIVDTVLQFEGDRNYNYRILRTTKNRFGSTSELGIYEMVNEGMREVSNPSEILLSHRNESLSGVAITATIEGLRPMLIEIQSLVSTAVYGTPQRTSTGFDMQRLRMLLAVLERRGGFKFGVKDVFINIAGGLRVEDPAIDLAVVCALISSYEDVAIPQQYCFAGEVGLSGEVRAVSRIEQRIAEADKLGFEKIFISSFSQKGLDVKKFNLKVEPVSKVQDIYKMLFG